MIRKLTFVESHLTSNIHLRSMSDEFLPSFGIKFLEIVHHYLLKHPDVIAYGNFKNGELTGFIIGSSNSSRTLKQIIITAFFKLLPRIFRKIIKSPKIIIYLWETLILSAKNNQDISAELLIIAINFKHRKQKIGSRLFNKFSSALRKKSVKLFKIKTLKTNTASNAFYQKIGASFIFSFTLYGKVWNEYVYKL